MASDIGKIIKVSIFGESHSKSIGTTVSGIPAGIKISNDKILEFMARRKPGKNPLTTQRSEDDIPEVISGIVNGVTTGTPITAIIKNTNKKSNDYDNIKNTPRPSHADFAAFTKYGEAHDYRGGGHFSGRLTAPLCFAGSICKQILENEGISIHSHIFSIGDVKDKPFDPVNPENDILSYTEDAEIPTIISSAASKMASVIKDVKDNEDSIGGVVECCVLGLPPGIGEPIFDGVENKLSQIVFGIPAVKGIEFGSGFKGASMKGSDNNDEFYFEDETIKTGTNNSGGILGGISNGMPIIFRAAFKPTPSIGKPQRSVNMKTMKEEIIEISGRHDPCIVLRAGPCVEAAAAIGILDLIYEGKRS